MRKLTDKTGKYGQNYDTFGYMFIYAAGKKLKICYLKEHDQLPMGINVILDSNFCGQNFFFFGYEKLLAENKIYKLHHILSKLAESKITKCMYFEKLAVLKATL